MNSTNSETLTNNYLGAINNSSLATNNNDPEEQPEIKKGFINKKLVIGIGFTILTIAFGVGVWARSSSADKSKQIVDTNNATEQQNVPEVTDTLNQTSTAETTSSTEPTKEKSPELELTVKGLEIQLSTISSPEDLARAFDNERVTAWINAGATPENAQAAMKSTDTLEDYATKIANSYDGTFEDALLAEGWRTNQDLSDWAKRMETIHKSTLWSYFLTSFPDTNSADIAPYRREIKFIEASGQDHSQQFVAFKTNSITVIDTTLHDTDNANLNRISTKFGGGVTGEYNYSTRWFAISNGIVKLSDIKLGR